MAGQALISSDLHILLVAVHPSRSPQSISLANAFLQAYLQLHQPLFRTTPVEFLINDSPQASANRLSNLKPSAVAFSLYVWNRKFCLETARLLKTSNPGLMLFAGGPEATADPQRILAEGCFDFIISGEGELPLLNVCNVIAESSRISPCSLDSIAKLPGIATLDNSRNFSLNPAIPPAILDDIPSPWLSGVLDCKRHSGILWQLSRGCSFTCDFCFDSRGIHGVRRFSLNRIEAELRYFAKNKVSQVFVLDSTFNQDLKRAKTILKLIRKIAPDIHFHFEVRSEFIDRELAELFAHITCSLQIGLQSSNPKVLRAVGRSFRQDDFTKRIMYLNHSGAIFGFDLIYGLPGETLGSFKESINFALGLYPNHIDIFPLAILPGTTLFKRAGSMGLVHNQAPPYCVINSPDMTGDDFKYAQRLANACDVFYTRGKAVAWFLGIIEVLGIKPTALLELFASFLTDRFKHETNEADLNDHLIWQLQRSFLTTVFNSNKLRHYLPTVLDLVDYHYYYAACVMTPPPKITKRINPGTIQNMVFKRSESTYLATFNHEILSLIEAGSVDIRYFTRHLPRNGSFAIIYPTASGVVTDSVDMSYYRLLEIMDGTTPLSQLQLQCALTPDIANEFIHFAVSEGIIITV